METFKLTKQAANVVAKVDEKHAKKIEKASTPEALVPLLRAALNKCGRTSAFTANKVSDADWVILKVAYINALEETLSLAKYL